MNQDALNSAVNVNTIIKRQQKLRKEDM